MMAPIRRNTDRGSSSPYPGDFLYSLAIFSSLTKAKQDNRDRSRISQSEPYEVEHFHQKHKHLSHADAVRIIKGAGGNREKADAAAEKARR
ncbi:MAG TPA: hypothetical protein VGL34_24015 [Steroidobacteraceae bacterium]|jgi:hypothetical protein